MPAKKAAKGSSKKAIKGGALPPYGIAIKESIARGNAADMKKTAAYARKYVKDVQTALAALDKAIKK
jgi:Domain of unknown function (DUF1843)